MGLGRITDNSNSGRIIDIIKIECNIKHAMELLKQSSRARYFHTPASSSSSSSLESDVQRVYKLRTMVLIRPSKYQKIQKMAEWLSTFRCMFILAKLVTPPRQLTAIQFPSQG